MILKRVLLLSASYLLDSFRDKRRDSTSFQTTVFLYAENNMVVPSEAERREIARRHLDSAENWLRTIAVMQLSGAFGIQYFEALLPSGASVVPKRIQGSVAKRRNKKPDRYHRDIDATMLGEVIDIVLHPELYRDYFRSALRHAYPDGKNEARTFLTRLETLRNQLAHGGTCSVRDLEQCACYANDVIDSIKTYFRDCNMKRDFNVPTFTRVVDSKGNDVRLSAPDDASGHFLDFRTSEKGDLYPGDILRIDVEVDESFQSSKYSIRWMTFNGDRGEGAPLELTLESRHVGQQMEVRFEVISNKDWHRLSSGVDDMLSMHYRVLPPS